MISFIKNLYYKFLLWKEFDNEDSTLGVPSIPRFSVEKQVTNEAYYFGIKKIRNHVHQLVNAKTKDEYERVLKELTELQDFAVKNTDPQYLDFIDNLKKVYVYSGTDIKDESDKQDMIEKRIKNYYELQRHKLKRQKIKEQRKKNDVR